MIKEVINNYQHDFLRIEYMLGNVCNYKCSYCFPGSNEGDALWPDIEKVKVNLSHLLDHYQANGKTSFQFYMVGGEPTIWKDLPELAHFLKEKYNAVINLSTNAGRSLNWWQNNTKHYDYVEISVHHEYVDSQHIIDVADMLYDADTNVVANVLMDPNHFDRCKELIQELQSSNRQWPIIAKAVLYNGTTRYTDEQKQFFAQQTKRAYDTEWYDRVNKEPVKGKVIWVKNLDDTIEEVPNDSWFAINNANRFKWWNCNLGVDFLTIHKDGTLTGNCRQVLWGRNTHFNLYDDNFTQEFHPKIKPVICYQEICTCSSEVVIKKHA